MSYRQLNTVIIDDDASSRKLLHLMLKRFPEVNVVGEAENILKAVDLIKRKNPDSVFLDIQLRNESGFELIKKIKTHPKIVFVSSFDEYALQAFDVDALDYLQKPIGPKRLEKTIKRLLESSKNNVIDLIKPNGNGNGYNGNGNGHNGNGNGHNGNGNGHNGNGNGHNGNGNGHNGNGNGHNSGYNMMNHSGEEYCETLVEDDEDFTEDIKINGNSNKVLEYDDRLFVTSDGVSKFLKISSIVCITAEKDYSYIHTSYGKKHLVLKSMVEWEERLTPKHFVRIHRSTIVNLEYIEKVEKWFNSSYHVFLQNHNEPFKMSRRYAAKLKERFK